MGEWIGVKDRLPEQGIRVLVSSNKFVGEAFLTNINVWYRYVGLPLLDVTHWMPMPEPAEED